MATNYTLEMLESLDKAIASGALSVKYGDKLVTYRSLSEMIQIKKLMQDDLGIGIANNGRTYASVNKGM